MRSPAPHPNSVRDYYAGHAAAQAGEARDGTRSAWWLYGWDVGSQARWLDGVLG